MFLRMRSGSGDISVGLGRERLSLNSFTRYAAGTSRERNIEAQYI
jgi:hypothetical protein